ncbi:hypothetical protein STEG23_005739 [Scotinomys teguina]
MALRSRPDQLLKIPKDLLNQHSSPPTSNRPPSASLCILYQVLAIFTFSFIPPYPEDCDHYDPLHRRKNAEDENLWIASRMVWFNQPRPPDSSQTAPVKTGPSS